MRRVIIFICCNALFLGGLWWLLEMHLGDANSSRKFTAAAALMMGAGVVWLYNDLIRPLWLNQDPHED